MAYVEGKLNAYKIFFRNPDTRHHLGNHGKDLG